MENIHLIEGDITQAQVDAIVNAANPVMLGGGGVDGAIHRAAGPGLLEACRQVPAVNGIRCPSGEARITHAGNLQASYVIHTVGPIYRQAANPEQVLQSAYENSLNLALDKGCRTIALPAISCGVYGYPVTEAAEVAFEVCRREKYRQLNIYFYLFSAGMKQAWSSVFERR